jgi:aryl-alcohol dehydrogenase-like predicted oxidoreductase
VPSKEARRILEIAHLAGIRALDTAALYGDIEERLSSLCKGLEFSVISKIPSAPLNVEGASIVHWIRDSIARSHARLGDLLKTVLFHRAADLKDQRSLDIWGAALKSAEERNLRLGVSCYSPGELSELTREFSVPVAQLPGNALDQRIAQAMDAGTLVEVEVHMRSPFLQGLLLMSTADVAKRLPTAAAAVERWHAWCAEREWSPLQAALALAKGTPGVRYVVLGVDRAVQLEEIVRAWEAARPLRAPEVACTDESVIDPRRWASP